MMYHRFVTSSVKHGPGRPPKYGRASRQVSVTLPEDVTTRLTMIDVDLGRAIVHIAEGRTPKRPHAIRPAEIASYGNHAVIIVTPVKALKRLAGVQLVPIATRSSITTCRRPSARRSRRLPTSCVGRDVPGRSASRSA
jgi:hypothetical protein